MANKVKSSKWIISAMVFGVLVVTALAYYAESKEQPEGIEVPSPQRPENVPSDAVFRGGPDGGYFIKIVPAPLKLADGRALSAYHVEIYHAFSGDMAYQGNGLYVPPREIDPDGREVFLPAPPVAEILDSTYYSFGALEFPVEGAAAPGRIIPLPLE
ncbi:MAG: hypothetical protein Q4G28_01710 [Neisseria sp.]|nr:hypothetical protein [Neisseria sp.]